MKRTALARRTKPMKRTAIKRMSARQRKRLATWATVTLERMAEVGNVCERCGDGPQTLVSRRNGVPHLQRLQGHHRLPRSQGGEDVKDNCVVLCGECHRWTHEHPSEAYALGLLQKRNGRDANCGGA